MSRGSPTWTPWRWPRPGMGLCCCCWSGRWLDWRRLDCRRTVVPAAEMPTELFPCTAKPPGWFAGAAWWGSRLGPWPAEPGAHSLASGAGRSLLRNRRWGLWSSPQPRTPCYSPHRLAAILEGPDKRSRLISLDMNNTHQKKEESQDVIPLVIIILER